MRKTSPRLLGALLLAAFAAAPSVLPGAAAAAPAQPDTTRWTPELTMRYDVIAEVEISPGGQHVAYVTSEAVMEQTTSTLRRQIHVVATDGSFDKQYTQGEHSNWSPRWSPDGTRLAFLSTRSEKPQVHVMPLKGGEAHAVTDAQTGVNSFQWGPAGERIAYTMTDPKSEAECQREREKRDVHVVGEEFRYDHLYITEVEAAGKGTEEVQRLTGGSFHVTSFDWAPDGETIAFAHRPNPRFNSGVLEGDISTVPADSGAMRPLVDRPGVDRNPHYAPNGQTVAFTSHGGKPKPVGGLYDVYTVPADGGAPTVLGQTPNRDAVLVGWMAQGEGLLVWDFAGTSTHVYAVPADGDAVRQVTTGRGLYKTPLSGATPTYSRSADRLAYTYQSSETPPEVYVSSRQDFTRRKLTNVHADVPRPEMGRTERATWRGPDDTEIEGLLTYPGGYKGGRVPLVLHVHGGPADSPHLRQFTGGRSYYTDLIKTQVFAQHGYAVLRPNPRGSTGYGYAFRTAVTENWGPGPFQDLMAGVDKVVEMGVAHPDSLAIMGWSYGGYMTAFAVTQTDRFKVASIGAGISNLISWLGTTDVPDWQAANFNGPFWENMATYQENSAIYHVEDANTPTQVLHGARDERVPPSQGREFYRTLKRRGVPTEMVLYPRSPHAPREPKQQMDITPRMIRWFDQHLGRSSPGS